jgi:hypothetical protein
VLERKTAENCVWDAVVFEKFTDLHRRIENAHAR